MQTPSKPDIRRRSPYLTCITCITTEGAGRGGGGVGPRSREHGGVSDGSQDGTGREADVRDLRRSSTGSSPSSGASQATRRPSSPSRSLTPTRPGSSRDATGTPRWACPARASPRPPIGFAFNSLPWRDRAKEEKGKKGKGGKVEKEHRMGSERSHRARAGRRGRGRRRRIGPRSLFAYLLRVPSDGRSCQERHHER